MAKETISKNKQKKVYGNAADVITVTGSSNKIYTMGGKDRITLNKGKNNMIDAGVGNDTIIIGKKAGDNNTFIAGKGNDTVTVNGGKQIIDGGAGTDQITIKAGTQSVNGGAGNDIITVNGGNYHTLQGGAGSDKYIVKTAVTKNSFLTIDQSGAGKKDKDILQLAEVSTKDVKLGVANGTLSIKHKNGGGIVVENYNKNKLSEIQFKDGTMTAAAVKKASKKTSVTSVTWKKGKTVTLDAKDIVSELQVTGHKGGDFVATLNSKGQLVLREKEGDKGKLTINNWNTNTVSKFVFKVGSYSKAYTAGEFKERTFTLTSLKDNAKYTGGLEVNQEFRVKFSTNTNIVINSPRSGVNRDRISFTNAGGWSTDHEDLYVRGGDLILGNWDSQNKKTLDGKITIKNFMSSSVREIEFSNQTYRLITHTSSWSGSDTYSDRFVILDGVKNGNNPNVGDWNVTLDNVRANDVIDLRALPANSRFYSLNGNADGKDLVLTHHYYETADASTTLGALRLKNFFNANGTVNTTNGYDRVRINREFYAPDAVFGTDAGLTEFNGLVWKKIIGKSVQEEKNYRWAYLNAGTANADTVNLGSLSKPNSNYVWMYYAGGGNDKVTAQAGDIVYGGLGNDTLIATGRMSDIHGEAGNDTITVGSAKKNLDKVNVYGGSGSDVIEAYGSYHYIAGGLDNDKIDLYSAAGDANTAKYSCITGGKGDDTITIHGGQDHLVRGGLGNDVITITEGGESHEIYGGDGTDTMSVDGVDNYLSGGNANDKLIVVGGYGHNLYGNDGNDTFTVNDGDNIQLHGGSGSDTYVINSGFTADHGLHIHQNTRYGFNAGDADVLELTGINTGNVEFEFQENCLWICGLEDGNRIGAISVMGWDENPLASIKFADGTMTTQQINALRT